MAFALAKLADLKSLLGTSSTDQDALLNRLLINATEAAEGLCGVDDGCLRRAENIVEFVGGIPYTRRFVRLAHMPIESISSVKQMWSAGSDADFLAVDSLVENQDYVVDSIRGKLERINAAWYTNARCLRVVYTGGWIDPATTGTLPSGALLPPMQLQHGICQEAIRLFQRRDMGGITQASNSAGAVQVASDQAHPDLLAAVASIRRLI